MTSTTNCCDCSSAPTRHFIHENVIGCAECRVDCQTDSTSPTRPKTGQLSYRLETSAPDNGAKPVLRQPCPFRPYPAARSEGGTHATAVAPGRLHTCVLKHVGLRQ